MGTVMLPYVNPSNKNIFVLVVTSVYHPLPIRHIHWEEGEGNQKLSIGSGTLTRAFRCIRKVDVKLCAETSLVYTNTCNRLTM